MIIGHNLGNAEILCFGYIFFFFNFTVVLFKLLSVKYANAFAIFGALWILNGAIVVKCTSCKCIKVSLNEFFFFLSQCSQSSIVLLLREPCDNNTLAARCEICPNSFVLPHFIYVPVATNTSPTVQQSKPAS